MENYPFEVSVDSNLDGVFDTYLQMGQDLNFLNNNEYFIDENNSTVIFGGLVNGGYVPPEGNANIRINYSGVHAIFEVYTGNPDSAENLEITPTNVTHIVFEYDIPLDASKCYVQRTTNISKGWFNQELLSNDPSFLVEGLELIKREYPTDLGPVDLLCRNSKGETVAVEIKRRGEIDGVEQLTRYLDFLNRDPLIKPVSGIFAAQEIRPQAKVLAEDRGIQCVIIDYDEIRGIESNHLRLF